MSLLNWPRNQADEIIRCAQRWVKRLDEQGKRNVPSPPSARSHKKRHSVNRERSYEARARTVRQNKKIAANLAESQRRKAIVRDYFAGRTADLSALGDAGKFMRGGEPGC